MLIPFLTSVRHQFSHSWHFLAHHQPWLPASSQLHADMHRVVQTQADSKPSLISQESKMQIFYELPFVVKRFHWRGASALQLCGFCTKSSSRTLLCFSPITLLFQHRQGVEGTAWKNHFPLNSVVST